jgi:multidrug efflux pump subunit AcrB
MGAKNPGEDEHGQAAGAAGRHVRPADRKAPHISIDIDRDTASRLGVSLALIDQTLYDAFGQRQVATIYTSSTQL